jgi:PAS domain S-box-containing protein
VAASSQTIGTSINGPRAVVALLGTIVLGLGIAVFAGWAIESSAIVQVQTKWPPMHTNAALAFLACGGAIVGLALDRTKWVAIGAAVTLLISGLSALEYLTGITFIDTALFAPFVNGPARVPGPMPPASTMCFLAAGLGLASSSAAMRDQARFFTLAVPGLLVLAASVLAQLGYAGELTDVSWWRFARGMPLHSSFGFSLIGGAMTLQAWFGCAQAGHEAPSWASWLAGALLVGITIMFWQSLHERETKHVEDLLANEAHEIRTTISERLATRARALTRMRERWEHRGGTPESEWLADAEGYVRDYAGLTAITWTDTHSVVRWVVAATGNRRARGLDESLDAVRRKALDKARAANAPAIAGPVTLLTGRLGFLMAVPLTANGRPDGIITAIVQYDTFLAELIRESAEKGFGFALWHEGSQVLNSLDASTIVTGHEIAFSALSSDFRIEAHPLTSLEVADLALLPEIALATGLIGSILLIAVLTSLSAARRRAVEIVQANERLSDEIEAHDRISEELRKLNQTLERRVADRTRALQAEMAQHAHAEERFRLAIEASPSGMLMADQDGTIVMVNAKIEQMFGYSRAELLGQSVDILVPHEFQSNHPQHRAHYHANPETRTMGVGRDLRALRKDGSEFPVEIGLNPVNTESGRLVLAVVVDITARIAGREAIKKANAELERRVRERTTALASVNAELEAFAYSVSHDLRGPVRAMDGFSQALLEDYSDKLDGEALDFLKRIRAGSQRMGELIDDLLKLSRVTRAELNLDRVDVSAAAERIVAELRDADPARRIEIEIEPSLSVHGDKQLIDIALQNLIGNAWKFTRKRDVARIEIGQCTENGTSTFFIRDNGAGFDPAYVDKLFKPFQRLHRDNEFEGTGIGLATTARVMRKHGGSIRAESKLDGGATFYFSFETYGETGI